MNPNRLLLPAIALAFAGVAAAQKPPAAALEKAMARATVHNKRVLAVIVDEGQDLVTTWKRDSKLRRDLSYEFEVVQFAGRQADKITRLAKLPGAITRKPALAVFAADGKVLARLESDAFMKDGKVVAETLLAQLRPHYCKPVDALKKLSAALGEAKKTGRNVFIRFDAPW